MDNNFIFFLFIFDFFIFEWIFILSNLKLASFQFEWKSHTVLQSVDLKRLLCINSRQPQHVYVFLYNEQCGYFVASSIDVQHYFWI